MNIMQIAKLKVNAVKAALVTGSLMLASAANAALSADVKSAVQGGFGDAQEAGGLMVIGFAGIFAVLLVAKLLRR